MGLLQLLPTSKFGLGGKPGPEFENERQKSTSNIQALVKGQSLASSQDIITGRSYGKGKFTAFAPPSQLDLNGQTPDGYLNHLPG